MTQCITKRITFNSNVALRNEELTYSLKDKEVLVKRINYIKYVAFNSSSEGTRTQEFYRRGNFCYLKPQSEFLKSLALVIILPLTTLIVKIIFPLLVHKPLVLYTSLFGTKAQLDRLKEPIPIELDSSFLNCNMQETINPSSLNPLRAMVALIGHVAICILALIPPFSNFFNKLNGDLERWVNGHSAQDVIEKSWEKRLKESFYIAPCQQPRFYLESKEKVINYSDLENSDKNLTILKGLARAIKF
jgi:hypothetical protein